MQFTIRSMLWVTAVIAGFCGLFLAVPDSFAIPVLSVTSISMLCFTIALAVATQGTTRAFGLAYAVAGSWLPFFVGFAFAIVAIDGDPSDFVGPEVDEDVIFTYKGVYGAQFAFSLLTGAFAIAICRYFNRRIKSNPPATITISPHDASELYAILQGRFGGGAELIPTQTNQLATTTE
jgi:hypothetical protein